MSDYIKNISDFRKKYPNLVNKIENICNDYKLENFSIGRLLTVVAYSKNFNDNELLQIGKILDIKKKDDFKFAYKNLRRIMQRKYEVELTPNIINNKSVEIFNNEFEFLQFLINKYKNNSKIKKFGDFDNLKLHTQNNNTKYYVIDTKKISKKNGISNLDLLILREKTDESIISKEIERYSRLFFPLESDKIKMIRNGLNSNLIDNKIFYDYCIGLLERIFHSGNDFQEFIKFHNKLSVNSDTQYNIAISAVEKLFLTDIVGFKITGKMKEILGNQKIKAEVISNTDDKNLSLNQFLIKHMEKFNQIFVENNYKKNKKDLSIVRAYRGDNIGSYHEARLSIDDSIIISDITGSSIDEYDITPHYLYKTNLFRNLRGKLNVSEDFYKSAMRIAKTKNLNLENILLKY